MGQRFVAWTSMPLHIITGRLPYYVPPDRKDRRGRTPLFNAVQRGEIERARAYLDGGHRVHVKDRDGMYLLTFAIHQQHVRPDGAMVQLLLDRTQRLDGGLGPQALIAAARHGQLIWVQALAARGVPLDAETETGDNALTAAVGPAHDAVLDWLIAQGVPVENQAPGTIRSALLTAVLHLNKASDADRARRLHRIGQLLDAGANPNRVGTGAVHATTPALLAVEHNDLDLLDRMIASHRGVDVHQRVRGVQILGAVMMRTGQHDPGSRAMFERVMALQPRLNDGPVTGDDLALVCALFDQLDSAEKAHRIRALLDAGADPMARSPAGACVLNLLLAHAFNGKPTTVALRDPALLERLASCPTLDVNALDAEGHTPLMRLASPTGIVPLADQAARWLLDHGADINEVSPDGWTLLSSLVGALPNSVLTGDAYARLLDVVLAQPLDWFAGRRPDHEDLCPGGYVAHAAVGRLPTVLLERMVQAGMPLDQTDTHGNTPLHRAVQLGLVSNGRVLLAAGASVRMRNWAGQRPHDMADPSATHPLREEVLAVYEQGAMRQALDHADRSGPVPRLRSRL